MCQVNYLLGVRTNVLKSRERHLVETVRPLLLASGGHIHHDHHVNLIEYESKDSLLDLLVKETVPSWSFASTTDVSPDSC